MVKPPLSSFLQSTQKPSLSSFEQSTQPVTPQETSPTEPTIKPFSTRETLKAIPGAIASAGKSIFNAFTSSEQGLGNEIAAGVGANQSAQNNTEQVNQESKNLQLAIQARNKLKTSGQDTAHADQMIADLVKGGLGQGSAPAEVAPATNDTTGQVLGNAGGVALDIASLGSLGQSAKSFALSKAVEKPVGTSLADIGKNFLKNAATYGGIGYGYDVTGKLKEGQTGGEAFKPGLGTALGVAIPGAGAAISASKVIGKEAAPGIINSLVKPLLKDFSYGKNPGEAIAKEGIIGNSLEDLGHNVTKRKNQIGQEIGALSSSLDAKAQSAGLPEGAKLNLGGTLKPIDVAMQKAAQDNNLTLLRRLQDVKIALTHDLSQGVDEAGNVTIEKGAAKDLANSDFASAFKLKTRVGDITQWTGNASDDKAVNSALKGVYGSIKNTINSKVEKVSPADAVKLKALNERYADLTSADVAIKYRDKINARQNMISAPIKAGAIAGLMAAPFTGGISVPTMLIGLGAAGIEKALGSTAVKTRIASWLAKESPGVIERFTASHPEISSALNKAFSEDVKLPGADQRGKIFNPFAPSIPGKAAAAAAKQAKAEVYARFIRTTDKQQKTRLYKQWLSMK